MNFVYRSYRRGDRKACENLVGQVWNFTSVFKNPGLRKIASLGYTVGSLEDSNYAQVVEVDRKVVGFLFGRNENKAHFKYFLFFKLTILWRLLFFNGNKSERNELLAALKTHIKNRSRIVPRGKSEILLFVVDPAFQGQGLGEKLWNNFRDYCADSGVESVYVSTNTNTTGHTSGAVGFYETAGFTHHGDFCSPLHAIAQWPGTPCMYQFNCCRSERS